MFEFLKKLSIGNNINDDRKRIVSGSYNSVGYTANNYVLREINRWMKEVGIYNITFGELLCKFGFVKHKTLWFETIPSDDNTISLSFQYKEDLYEGDRLDLSLKKTYSNLHRLEPDSYEIKISGDNYEKIYGIKSDISLEDRIKLVKKLDHVKESIDDTTYYRTIQENGFRIVINNYFFNEIRLVCNKDGIKINNEDELKEYLLNLDDTATVSEVYRRICEISLGNENEYDKIDLSLCKGGKTVGNILFQTKADYGIFNPSYKYEILENGNAISFSISPSLIMILNGNRMRNIELVNKDYRIRISISPFVYETNLDMVGPLRNYLMSLEFPVKMDELCNNICDKCLVDINNLSYFKVECFYKDESTDLIHLEGGKLLSFQMNKDGKKVSIDKDGNFSYGCNSNKGSFSVKINNDIVTGYDTYMDSGIENDNMGNVMYNHINDAKNEKVRTRKVIDGILK